jgi:hypothetical protein
MMQVPFTGATQRSADAEPESATPVQRAMAKIAFLIAIFSSKLASERLQNEKITLCGYDQMFNGYGFDTFNDDYRIFD